MTREEKDEREERGRGRQGDLEKSLFFFFYFLIFIYVIGCAGSQLRHAGASLWRTGSSRGAQAQKLCPSDLAASRHVGS